MSWLARKRAACEREALAVIADPGAAPDDVAGARAYLTRADLPPLDYSRLSMHELAAVEAYYRLVLGERLEPPVAAAPSAERPRCPRCGGLTDDDLAELRLALDDDIAEGT